MIVHKTVNPPELLDDLYYFLNKDKSVIKCSLKEFSEQLNEMMINDSKHVKKSDIGNFWISTVWLGINHNWGSGSPILFETMILNKYTQEWLDYLVRYSTWDNALIGHENAIQYVKDGCKDE